MTIYFTVPGDEKHKYPIDGKLAQALEDLSDCLGIGLKQTEVTFLDNSKTIFIHEKDI